MTNWEYKKARYKDTVDGMSFLADDGRLGWEVYHVRWIGEGIETDKTMGYPYPYNEYEYHMKRPIEEEKTVLHD